MDRLLVVLSTGKIVFIDIFVCKPKLIWSQKMYLVISLTVKNMHSVNYRNSTCFVSYLHAQTSNNFGEVNILTVVPKECAEVKQTTCRTTESEPTNDTCPERRGIKVTLCVDTYTETKPPCTWSLWVGFSYKRSQKGFPLYITNTPSTCPQRCVLAVYIPVQRAQQERGCQRWRVQSYCETD